MGHHQPDQHKHGKCRRIQERQGNRVFAEKPKIPKFGERHKSRKYNKLKINSNTSTKTCYNQSGKKKKNDVES